MKKLLTVSIAAYNAEKYLKNCLDSILGSKHLDQIEILIQDDGSKDGTKNIALDFCNKYPGIVFLNSTTNGGYGATINRSLSQATGKYFKLLDSDDSFDAKELDKLMEFLDSYEKDLLVVSHKVVSVSTKKEQLFRFPNSKNLSGIGRWDIVIKTDVLKAVSYSFPSKLFFTDNLFCALCFSLSNSFEAKDFCVYVYNVGISGQSTEPVQDKKKLSKIADNVFFIINELIQIKDKYPIKNTDLSVYLNYLIYANFSNFIFMISKISRKEGWKKIKAVKKSLNRLEWKEFGYIRKIKLAYIRQKNKFNYLLFSTAFLIYKRIKP